MRLIRNESGKNLGSIISQGMKVVWEVSDLVQCAHEGYDRNNPALA